MAYSVRKDLVTREDMIPTPNLLQIERDQNILWVNYINDLK